MNGDRDTARATTARSKILVVEDEHLVALDIKLRLEKMGHRAVVAYSGEEAIDVATGHFDLVLMDIKLRGLIDGIEAARKIRGAFDIAVIYLTAYADDQTLERARTTEPYGYLLKPFHERELQAVIEMALQRHGGDKQRWEQQQVQHFLAEASARMAATLDYRSLARSAAELLVPRYADWCAIQLRESDSIPGYTHTHPDGERDRALRIRIGVIESVERTAHSEILPRLADDTSLADALGGEFVDMLRVLGVRSVLCVPLIARDQVLGALALVAGRERARYSSVDLAFVEDFGQRLGMALDNALLYRKSERAIQMRDDVLAIVSHDLRTPLSTISMLAELLVDHVDLHKTGLSIARAAKRMTRLIGDLLDASAINAGKLSLSYKLESGAAIVREVVEMFRPTAESSGIALVEELPDDDLQVACDRDRIMQVLQNVIGNALRFTPRDGTVTVSAARDPSQLRFEVRDTGAGIPPEQVPHLFERFWRAKGHNEGAGLGLFIAGGIVAAHGSTLNVETAVGAGTRFYFTLPAPPP